MFTYVVALCAVVLVFNSSVLQNFNIFSSEPRRLPRTPRPPINESLLAIDAIGAEDPQCPDHRFDGVHVFSRAPLVIYVEGFLSLGEREELLSLSEPLFAPSTTTSDGQHVSRNTSVRDSEVALLPRADLVRCLERRALALQGWREELWIERLRTQRYVAGGHYTHHFDWGSGSRGWGRVSSGMAWVASSGLEGGGTEFPSLRKRKEGEWCKFIECPDARHEKGSQPEANSQKVMAHDATKKQPAGELGVTFRVVPGNAVFWWNFRPDGTGRGFDETWHAGLPVTKGTKVGLNIWSWGRLD
ncbi:2OG-Fe(II) oxygenase family oxidoreductase [Xylariaceae sp. FL1019]|nr:2OG-Fe(II) oxygenase family oxidoreductase [Xylariaceae sp. FL1019]